MRKQLALFMAAILVMSLGLAGCGKRSQEGVLKDLQKVQSDLKTYHSKAMMVVQSPQSTQKHYIETSYQAPNLYRIALGNEKREITQVIIKNEDGIFVVNPQLKKSFRFQGDWAENQGGHVYLYHAMINRILQAAEKTYDMKNGLVTFEMAMQPENPIVTKQKIVLDDRKLYPKQVVLLSKEEKPVVTVDYESFETGLNFNKDTFTAEGAMALAGNSVPAMAGKTDFGVIEPAYLPKGMTKTDITEKDGAMYLMYQDAQGKAVTIVERRPQPGTFALPKSQMHDLYGSPAIVTGTGEAKTMYWTSNGIEFSMTAAIPVSEMQKIAQSTMGMSGK